MRHLKHVEAGSTPALNDLLNLCLVRFEICLRGVVAAQQTLNLLVKVRFLPGALVDLLS
jgi:hypothetical protein